MNRMAPALIAGKERQLNYSIEVMFNMREKFGSLDHAFDVLGGDDIEAFEAVRWFAVAMANDAELCRRDAGYDPQPMVSEDDISLRIQPLEFAQLRDAVIDAITLGYKRELVNEDEEVDVGLEELRSKKTQAGGM